MIAKWMHKPHKRGGHLGVKLFAVGYNNIPLAGANAA